MNTTSRIIMDQALIAQGYGASPHLLGGTYNPAADLPTAEAQMTTYLNDVQAHGVREFDSPVYSGTQLESLVEGSRFASDSHTKSNYNTALDYLWMDLSANWFNGNLRLAAPYSRNYKFLTASGSTQQWIEVLGCWTTGNSLATPTPTGTNLLASVDLEEAELLDILSSSHGYQPPSATYLTAIQQGSGTQYNHMVFQAWGPMPGGNNPSPNPTRIASVGTNVALGCSSGHYGPQDTFFAGALSGDATNAPVNLNQALFSTVLDSSGSPYGTFQYADAHGHKKTEHLQQNLACAFTGNAALVSMNIDGTQRSTADNGLWTNFLFPFDVSNLSDPAYATVAINKVPVSTLGCPTANSGTGTNNLIYCALSMGNDVVTFTGINGGVIGVKFLKVGWTDSSLNMTPQSPYQLEIDKKYSQGNPDGSANKAARIVLTHTLKSLANGSPSSAFRVSLLVVTDDTATDPTGVYNILHGASFVDDPSGSTQRLLKVTFSSSYRPHDASGNALYGLEVIRSTATLTDAGIAYADTGSGFVSALPSFGTNDTLVGIDFTGYRTNYSQTFWSTHTIY
jgi:hypothetical protein